MIASLTGELRDVSDDRIYVQVGPILYELLVTAADIDLLQAGVGEEMTFHTLFYLQGDASGGSIEPPRSPESHAHRFYALSIFAIMAVTDKLDGYLARRLNQASRLGALLDLLHR